MALGLGAGVPWVMCQQSDAPENIVSAHASHIFPFPCIFSSLYLNIFYLVLQINACNGFYCDGFKPNSYGKPTLWTEDWNGWLLFCLFFCLFV